MKKRVFVSAVILFLLAVAFVAGLAAGALHTQRWLGGMASVEVEGNLAFLVLELSQIRTGDTEGAIELMERRIDTALSTLTQGRDWEDLSENLQKVLINAKAYRTVFPPSQPSDGLTKALDMIPAPEGDFRSCRPAMQEVIEMSRSVSRGASAVEAKGEPAAPPVGP